MSDATWDNSIFIHSKTWDNRPVEDVCAECGRPVTNMWFAEGHAIPIEWDARKRPIAWRALNGTEMRDIHAQCYRTLTLELHDWREEMKWVNAPKGWWKPVPMEDVTVQQIKDVLQSIYVKEYKDERNNQAAFGGVGGIVSLDAAFAKNEDGSSVSVQDMYAADQAVSKRVSIAFKRLGAWHEKRDPVTDLEQDIEDTEEAEVLKKYRSEWQSVAWTIRRETGAGYREILKELIRRCPRKERFPGEKIPKNWYPHEDTIQVWINEWRDSGDPMELYIREKQAGTIKYTGIPRNVERFFHIRSVYKNAQSQEARDKLQPYLERAWSKIKHYPKVLLLKYYRKEEVLLRETEIIEKPVALTTQERRDIKSYLTAQANMFDAETEKARVKHETTMQKYYERVKHLPMKTIHRFGEL